MRTRNNNADTQDMRERLGRQWRKARENTGKSLAVVVQWLGERGYDTSIGAVSRFELGTSEPLDLQIFIRLLCALYGITPEDRKSVV